MSTLFRFGMAVGVVFLLAACNMPAPAPAPEPTPTEQVIELPTLAPDPTATTAVIAEPSPTPELEATAEPIDSPTEPPTEPATEPAATVSAVLVGNVVYDNNLLSWPTLSSTGPDGDASSQVTDAGYEIVVPRNWGHYAYTARLAENVFDARLTASPSECPASLGGYGLIFHYVAADNFRYAIIRCDGTYLIFEARPERRTLAEGVLPEQIDVTSGTHTIRVRIEASDAILIVDDIEITRVALSDTPLGDFAAYVRTFNEGGLRVVFTRLEVAR